MAGVMSPGSSRALRLDPYALPVRYAARDSGADGQVRNVELDTERVVLHREVSGIRMKIGVSMREFAGVTMRTLPPEGGEPAVVAVMLEHRDNGLTVPLFIATEGDTVMGRYKVTRISADVVELTDTEDGTVRRLALR